MKKNYLLLPAVSLCLSLTAQHRTCGTDEYVKAQMALNPAYKTNLRIIEEQTQKFLKRSISHDPAQKATTGDDNVVTIPVVFHVVYKKGKENVPDQQIINQVNVLNEDYSASNRDAQNTPTVFQSMVANTGIRFCLAAYDPAGKPTSGIIRVKTKNKSFSSNDDVKSSKTGGHTAWPADKYLNIWLCNMEGGLLGYATFPGGAAEKDGIVILYSSVPGGSTTGYNKGRTATHEVGHWLNLHHIWGDASCGNDLVDDTPIQQTANFGCPTFPNISCSNAGDMSMNYMDYTDDACMYMLTRGQSGRMNALFASGGAREAILNSKCGAPSGTNSIITERGIENPPVGSGRMGTYLKVYPSNVSSQLTIQTSAFAASGTTLRIFNMMGQQVISARIFQETSTLNVSALSPGIYVMKIGDGREQQMVRFRKQ